MDFQHSTHLGALLSIVTNLQLTVPKYINCNRFYPHASHSPISLQEKILLLWNCYLLQDLFYMGIRKYYVRLATLKIIYSFQNRRQKKKKPNKPNRYYYWFHYCPSWDKGLAFIKTTKKFITAFLSSFSSAPPPQVSVTDYSGSFSGLMPDNEMERLLKN